MLPGLHLLHKPEGPTSFSIVQSLQNLAEPRPDRRPLRMCHGGTLDPFASGLLLILVEPATRLFDYLHAIPKVYEATIHWGTETDNGDPTGQPIETADATQLTPAQIEQAANSFIGWHDQIPPATSNKRIAGERAYAKAHRSEEVQLPPSRVYLHKIEWLSHDLPHQSRLRLTARGGYYIRSLVRDLARSLDTRAHLTKLRRLAIGPWLDPGLGPPVQVPSRDILPWLPARVLSSEEAAELRKTNSISLGELFPPDWPIPEGFPPTPDPLIRGFLEDRLSFLLSQKDDRLAFHTALTGGL
jgi:tRNA pseudouridine55 synthase